MKRVIVVPDFPPKQAPQNVRASYQAAAKRWDAELIWFTHCETGGHCFWKKMQAFSAVLDQCSDAHVLQLDNDMLIREDCPSPFDLAKPNEFAMVAGRQRPDRRVDETSWGAKAHNIWAGRLKSASSPPALHPNGGLYLYGLPHFTSVWHRIDLAAKQWRNYGDMGADESIISNILWTWHREAIRFLPQEFNTILCQNAGLLRDKFSPTYITHYAMGAKNKLAGARWQTTDWPWAKDDPIRRLSDQLRCRKHNVGCVESPDSETICKLLILFPEMRLYGLHVHKSIAWPDDLGSLSSQLSASHTDYLLLRQVLADLGPLSHRYHSLPCTLAEANRWVGSFDFVLDGDQLRDANKFA
jgi:hypothetical protein